MRLPVFLGTTAVLLLAGLATAQQDEWRRAPVFAPTAGGAGQLAYDTLHHRMLWLVGDQLWLGDGVHWRLGGVLPAGALQQPATAFDRARGLGVLFGGSGLGGFSAQTWAWNGTAWNQVVTATSPAGRWFSPLAYDVVRQRIVMYGGETQAALRNDTWEFDGVNWAQQFPVHSPNSRGRHGLVFDEQRGVSLLFGGMDATGTGLFAETWQWNGLDWTQQFPAQSPPARRNHGMAYDRLRSRSVVFGGYDSAQSTLTDTWEFDGSNWQRVGVGQPAPPHQLSQSLAADPDRGGVFLMEAAGGALRTWRFDGTGWRIDLEPTHPGIRDQHAMAYDPARDETLLFGNWFLYGLPALQATTWVHRGGVWERRTPGTSPPFTQQPALAFDPAGGGTLMFGGLANGLLSGVTWRWNGLDWSRLPGPNPPPRSAAAMASDTGRNRIVLFGGDGGASGWLGDTWEWNGTSWLLRTPAASPPPREGHAMTYDPRRGRTVLFGGGDLLALPTLGDHWEWDGATWSQVTVPLPPPRSAHSLVFDTVTQKVLLLGGQFLFTSSIPVPRNDLWEWDGTTWTQRANPVPGPPSRAATVAAHDQALGRTLLFGGGLDVDTWLLGPTSTANVVSYGTACPGSFGNPEFSSVGHPFLGNPWFATQLSALPPGAIALVGLSTRAANLPLLGGCTALVDQPFWVGGTTDSRGALDLAMPIPNLASLRGSDAFAQAVVVDPNGAFAHVLAFSAGLQVTID